MVRGVSKGGRRGITQSEIARRIGIDVSSVNKILNRRAGPVFRPETIRRVFQIARQLGYDFGRLKYQHRRRAPRRTVSIGAEFMIYHQDGSLFDQGMATIRDISLCGARVSDVALPQGSLPVDPFTVGLRPMQKPLDGFEIRGRIVRIHADGGVSFGIDFGRLDAEVQGRLRRFARG